MPEKSHELGGRRSHVRHNLENLGGAGIVWLVLNRLDGLTTIEKDVALGVGIVVLSGLAKFWNENELTKRILSKVGLAGLLAVMLAGCGISIGHVNPEEYEGSNGETIIACEMKGIQLGIGDGGGCRNAEGGHVSAAFVGLFTGTLEVAGKIVGALLSPLGAAGATLTAIEAPPPPEPPSEVPGRVVEPQAGSSSSLFE